MPPLYSQGMETLRNPLTQDVQKSHLKTIPCQRKNNHSMTVFAKASLTQNIIGNNSLFICTVL